MQEASLAQSWTWGGGVEEGLKREKMQVESQELMLPISVAPLKLIS